jgi:peptide/nickel transport system substrate-binding protein
MARGRVLAAGGLAAFAALLLAASGTARGLKEGGTFRVAVAVGAINTIDPAFPSVAAVFLLWPACGTLMWDPPPAAGLRLATDLAEAEPIISKDGRTYTFTIRKDARFSDGRPVTARAFAHALERILDPAMQSFRASFFADIIGAQDVLAGKATTVRGLIAKGRMLTLRLTKRVPELLDSLTSVCAVPPTLPADPEGAKAPLPSPAPYYVAQYVPNERLVLERNRFYLGERPHHVDRFVADLAVDFVAAVDLVAAGTFDVGFNGVPAVRQQELARRYGVNRSRFFVNPGDALNMFVLNTSQPLFKNNPKLRQAVNFAVDRRALAREEGPLTETSTDQYLLPGAAGYRNERIYPLDGPDLRTARKLAKGHTRGGKAVLYVSTAPPDVARGEILKRNLKAIGLELETKQLPNALRFEKLATPGEPFDLARVRWFFGRDPGYLKDLFDGRTIGRPGFVNYSYFDSPKYNRLLDRAQRLTGEERYRAYGELDVQLSRDAAPAIPFAVFNYSAFVSKRTGCVVMNPGLDLTVVCLK